MIWELTGIAGVVSSAVYNLAVWAALLAVLGYGKHYLNTTNSVWKYFRNASFALYIFHQTVLIAVAYYVVTNVNSIPTQFAMIVALTFVITISIYEILRRIPPYTIYVWYKKEFK